MKKVTFDDIPKLARNESLFTDTVYAQSILEHEDSDNFNFAIVNFANICLFCFQNPEQTMGIFHLFYLRSRHSSSHQNSCHHKIITITLCVPLRHRSKSAVLRL